MTVALAAVAAVLCAALAVVSVLLVRSRRELAALRESVREQPRHGPAAATERVMRAVVSGAARLRAEGLTGMLSGSLDDLVQWARDDRAAIVRVAAPDGSVTFFFSDIENSTALNEQLGDARWLRILAAHDHVVRGRIEGGGGHVVKTVGDGFMAVFGDPAAAVRVALGIQRALRAPANPRLRRTRLAVRIGVHAGTAVSRDGDYFGRNVALAARVAGHAHGRQTLVTEQVRDAVDGDERLVLEPCGDVELKGITGTVPIWSVRSR